MMKPVLTACLAGLVLVPVAYASDAVPVTVTISYDPAMLATDDGAAIELGQITRQARKACTVSQAVSAAKTVDKACVEGLVAGAVTQIREKLSTEGGAVSPAFTLSEPMILAQTGQR